MKKDVFIVAPIIQKIDPDGTIYSSDAMYINPSKVVWMKTRCVLGQSNRPYTIIKMEGETPFMAEGEIDDYLIAMGMTSYEGLGWDKFDEEDEDYDDEDA